MKVLIVNDDLVALKFQQLIVERSDITDIIVTATNGQEALEYFSEAKDPGSYPRLILLDIDMPLMSGWEFLEIFSRDYLHRCPNTKVIIISYTVAYEQIEVKAKGYPCVIDFNNSGLTTQYLKKLEF